MMRFADIFLLMTFLSFDKITETTLTNFGGSNPGKTIVDSGNSIVLSDNPYENISRMKEELANLLRPTEGIGKRDGKVRQIKAGIEIERDKLRSEKQLGYSSPERIIAGIQEIQERIIQLTKELQVLRRKAARIPVNSQKRRSTLKNEIIAKMKDQIALQQDYLRNYKLLMKLRGPENHQMV